MHRTQNSNYIYISDGTGGTPYFLPPPTTDRNEDYDHDLKRRQEEHLKNVRRFRGYDVPNIRCAHDACPECIGTGVKSDGSRCVHMISCSCPRCTPYCMSTVSEGPTATSCMRYEVN